MDFKFYISLMNEKFPFHMVSQIWLIFHILRVVFEINERSEYSFIGLSDFFFSVLKFNHAQFSFFFCSSTYDFFFNSSHFFC